MMPHACKSKMGSNNTDDFSSDDSDELFTYLVDRKQNSKSKDKSSGENIRCDNKSKPDSCCETSIKFPAVSGGVNLDVTTNDSQKICANSEIVAKKNVLQDNGTALASGSKNNSYLKHNDINESKTKLNENRACQTQEKQNVSNYSDEEISEEIQRQFAEINMLNFSPSQINTSCASDELDSILEMFGSPSKYNLGKVALEPEQPALFNGLSSEVLASPDKYGSQNRFIMLSEYDFVKLCAMKSVSLPKGSTEVDKASRQLNFTETEKETNAAKPSTEFDSSLLENGKLLLSHMQTVPSSAHSSEVPNVCDSVSRNVESLNQPHVRSEIPESTKSSADVENDSSKMEIVFVKLFDEKPEPVSSPVYVSESSVKKDFSSYNREAGFSSTEVDKIPSETNAWSMPKVTFASGKQTENHLDSMLLTDFVQASTSDNCMYTATVLDSAQALYTDSGPNFITSESTKPVHDLSGIVQSDFVQRLPNAAESSEIEAIDLRKHDDQGEPARCVLTNIKQSGSTADEFETKGKIQSNKCERAESSSKITDLNVDMIETDCENTGNGHHSELTGMNRGEAISYQHPVQIRFERINDKLTKVLSVPGQDTVIELIDPPVLKNKSEEIACQPEDITLIVTKSGELIRYTEDANCVEKPSKDYSESGYEDGQKQKLDIKAQWKSFKPLANKKKSSFTQEEEHANFESDSEQELEEDNEFVDMSDRSESSDGEELTQYFTKSRVYTHKEKCNERSMKQNEIRIEKVINFVENIVRVCNQEEELNGNVTNSMAVQADLTDDSDSRTLIDSNVPNPYLSKLFQEKLNEAMPSAVKEPKHIKGKRGQYKSKSDPGKVNPEKQTTEVSNTKKHVNKKAGKVKAIVMKKAVKKKKSKVLTSKMAKAADLEKIAQDTNPSTIQTEKQPKIMQLDNCNGNKSKNDERAVRVKFKLIGKADHSSVQSSMPARKCRELTSNVDVSVENKSAASDEHLMRGKFKQKVLLSENTNKGIMKKRNKTVMKESGFCKMGQTSNQTDVKAKSRNMKNVSKYCVIPGTNLKSVDSENDKLKGGVDRVLQDKKSKRNDRGTNKTKIETKPKVLNKRKREVVDEDFVVADINSKTKIQSHLEREDKSNMEREDKSRHLENFKETHKMKASRICRTIFQTEGTQEFIMVGRGKVISRHSSIPEKSGIPNMGSEKQIEKCDGTSDTSFESGRRDMILAKLKAQIERRRQKNVEVDSQTVSDMCSNESISQYTVGNKRKCSQSQKKAAQINLEDKINDCNVVNDENNCIKKKQTYEKKGNKISKKRKLTTCIFPEKDKFSEGIDEIHLSRKKKVKTEGSLMGRKKKIKPVKLLSKSLGEKRGGKKVIKHQSNSDVSGNGGLNKGKETAMPTVKICKMVKRKPGRTRKRVRTRHQPGLKKAFDISWKDQLSAEAFELEISNNKKPVNVKKMLKNIFEGPEGNEKNRKKCKEMSEKRKLRKIRKEEGCDRFKRRDKAKLTSDSDEAWLSDSFPAFQFHDQFGQMTKPSNSQASNTIQGEILVSRPLKQSDHVVTRELKQNDSVVTSQLKQNDSVVTSQLKKSDNVVTGQLKQSGNGVSVIKAGEENTSNLSMSIKGPVQTDNGHLCSNLTNESDKVVVINSHKPRVSFMGSVTKQSLGSPVLLHSPLKGSIQGQLINKENNSIQDSPLKHASQDSVHSKGKSPGSLQKTIEKLNVLLEMGKGNKSKAVRTIQFPDTESHVNLGVDQSMNNNTN